jgi:hypothetical protein
MYVHGLLKDEADHEEPMEIDAVDVASIKKEKKKKKDKSSGDKPPKAKNALLSFDDDFNEGEIRNYCIMIFSYLCVY